MAQQQTTALSPSVYERATQYNVGTPLTRHRRRLLQVLQLVVWLLLLFLFGWIGYSIYGYVAYTVLAQTYPDAINVPNDQIETYLWLRTLHDIFWFNLLQVVAPLMTFLGQSFLLSSVAQTELVFCTEGMLKIDKKTYEAVRWDEVYELYLTNGKVSRLVKNDGSTFSLSLLLVSARVHTLILDEVTRHLLPGMLEQYMRGETISFDDLEVNQQGIARTGHVVEWQHLGAVSLARQSLSLYYSEHEKANQVAVPGVGKWHTWHKKKMMPETWPNLPLFVALVETILEQRGEPQMMQAPHALPSESIKETALRLKQRSQKRKVITIVSVAISIICLCSLFLGSVIFQSSQEQQRAEKATQALRNHFTALAHMPYTVHVPGEHCGDGEHFWHDDDSENSYICQPDGLHMTQKKMQYEDGEWFSFVPYSLSSNEAFSSMDYFPHHYKAQVQVAILSGEPDTCVGLEFHVHNFQGKQSFDLCADGSWAAYRCNAQCNTTIQLARGNLPSPRTSFLMEVEVTDTVLTLTVDHTKIVSVSDNTYTATNQLALILYGSVDALEPITARFSDFSYLPLEEL